MMSSLMLILQLQLPRIRVGVIVFAQWVMMMMSVIVWNGDRDWLAKKGSRWFSD
jgi:hypothetical protein